MTKNELIASIEVAIRIHKERGNSNDKFVAGIANGKVVALEWTVSAIKLLEANE
jgi:hypothetical protein